MEEIFLKKGLVEKNKIVFDFIFHLYYSGLCVYAESIIHNQEEVEDIVQDLFVKLWIKSSEIEITGSLKNYLFRSVKNRCFDHIKHQKVKDNSTRYLTNLKVNIPETAENWMVETELRQLIEKSINELPCRCQEIFRMSRFEGLKNQEIAEKLNLSKRTVELQISNALKRLRKDLKPYLPLFLLGFL